MDLYEANLAKFLNHRLVQAQGDLFLEHEHIIKEKQHELEENEFNRIADDMEKAYMRKNEELTSRVNAQLTYMKKKIDEKNNKKPIRYTDDFIIEQLTKLLMVLIRLLTAFTVLVYVFNYIMYDNPDPRPIEIKRIHEEFFMIPLLSNIFGPALFTFFNFSTAFLDYNGTIITAIMVMTLLTFLLWFIMEELDRKNHFNKNTTDGRLFKTKEARMLEQTRGEKIALKQQLLNDYNVVLSENEMKKSKEEAILRGTLQPNNTSSINVPGTPNYTMSIMSVIGLLAISGIFILLALFNDNYPEYFINYLPIKENLIYFKIGCFAFSGLLFGFVVLFNVAPVMFRTRWIFNILCPAFFTVIGICTASVLFYTPLVKDELKKKWISVLNFFVYSMVIGSSILFTQQNNKLHGGVFKGMSRIDQFASMIFVLLILSVIVVFGVGIKEGETIADYFHRQSKIIYVISISSIASMFMKKNNWNMLTLVIGMAIITSNVNEYIQIYEETFNYTMIIKSVSGLGSKIIGLPYFAFVEILEQLLRIDESKSKLNKETGRVKTDNKENTDTLLSGVAVLLVIGSLITEKDGVANLVKLFTAYFVTDKFEYWAKMLKDYGGPIASVLTSMMT